VGCAKDKVVRWQKKEKKRKKEGASAISMALSKKAKKFQKSLWQSLYFGDFYLGQAEAPQRPDQWRTGGRGRAGGSRSDLGCTFSLYNLEFKYVSC
jgi:hypothetical protein